MSALVQLSRNRLRYYTERYNVPERELVMLDAIRQSTVDAWVRLLTAARPDMTAAQARYAVHAAHAVIVDLGRLVRHNDSATPAPQRAA